MPKRPLSPTEAFDLRQTLHVATLEALMSSRRWQPGDLVFQGGTSLHLAYGSPRYSEDLDFLVRSCLNLGSIAEAMQTRLRGASWIPSDTELKVGAAKEGHNPHAFDVSIGGANVIGAVRVKVEMWKTEAQALSAVKAVVAPVRLASGLQTFVPTADKPEIYADKVFAIAARNYLKPRDVFDLHWLATHSGLRECSAQDMQVRLQTYPNETPQAWLQKAHARMQDLQTSADAVAGDLQRWLPSSWPLTKASVQEMIQTSLNALEQGVAVMSEIERSTEDETAPETPSP